jgi:DNA-binding GntR family transcriptional regulator
MAELERFLPKEIKLRTVEEIKEKMEELLQRMDRDIDLRDTRAYTKHNGAFQALLWVLGLESERFW